MCERPDKWTAVSADSVSWVGEADGKTARRYDAGGRPDAGDKSLEEDWPIGDRSGFRPVFGR